MLSTIRYLHQLFAEKTDPDQSACNLYAETLQRLASDMLEKCAYWVLSLPELFRIFAS